jgi:hypothetical protein
MYKRKTQDIIYATHNNLQPAIYTYKIIPNAKWPVAVAVAVAGFWILNIDNI